MVKRLLLAAPRGYCAGVERAVETVERALELHGAPVYVRRQIVHNAHVVRELGAEPVMILVVVDRGGTCGAMAEAEGIAFRALVTAPDLGFPYEGA